MRKAIDRRFFLRVEAGVIRDEADALVFERSEFLGFENIESGLHAAGAGFFCSGRFRGGRENKVGWSKEDDGEKKEKM